MPIDWRDLVGIRQCRHWYEAAVVRTVLLVRPNGDRPLLAQIVLFDGFDPLDAIAPYEVLEAGGLFTNGALVAELASAEGPRDVVGGVGGLVIRATAQLDPDRADVVIVPGAAGRMTSEGADDAATIPSLLAQTADRAAWPAPTRARAA